MSESTTTSTTGESIDQTTSADSSEETWYIATRKLHIPNSPGATPSSLRILKGQRFQLDGDEAIDIDDLVRIGVAKIYEESDATWAEPELAEARKPRRRRRSSGTNNS